MKFNETLLYKTLRIPGDEWNKSCGYVFLLKIPPIIFMTIVGVFVAIVIDFWHASSNVGEDA